MLDLLISSQLKSKHHQLARKKERKRGKGLPLNWWRAPSQGRMGGDEIVLIQKKRPVKKSRNFCQKILIFKTVDPQNDEKTCKNIWEN